MGRAGWLALLFATAAFSSACSSDGGAGACTTSGDCAAGQVCISSMCRGAVAPKACTSDMQCDIGSFCDTALGQCVTTSDGPRDAGTSTTTVRDGGIRDAGGDGTCTTDLQCGQPPIDVCVGNLCVKGCGQPDGAMCTGGTVCDTATGHCVPPSMMCLADGDCNPAPPTQICVQNMCVYGCGIDTTLCQTGELCDTGTGRCVTAPMPCAMDSECNPPMTVCEVPQCVPGCNQPGGVQCSGGTPLCDNATGRCTAGPTCNLDADCTGTNEICVNMTCVVRCDAPGGLVCNAPQVCNPADGRCAAGNLPLGDTCALDAQCASGFCLPLTVGGVSHEVCTRACGRGGDCPIDFSCADVVGMSFCLSENLLTPPATWDTPAGGACSTTVNTCQSGWCNTGTNQCIETCQRDNHCSGFGNQCWLYEQTGTMGTTFDHLCFNQMSGSADGVACTTNANCISGICNRYDSQCANHCCSDADCNAAQSCVVYDLDATTIVKICAPRSATAGTAALGATCTAGANCESEVCLPVDPTSMTSPMKCSTTCCTDADCSALPLGGRCRPLNGPVMGTIVGACIPN